MKIASREVINEEVRRNYIFFKKNLSRIGKEHDGQFALMHDEEIIDYFDDNLNAFVSGMRRYPDRKFSIQEVRRRPIRLRNIQLCAD